MASRLRWYIMRAQGPHVQFHDGVRWGDFASAKSFVTQRAAKRYAKGAQLIGHAAFVSSTDLRRWGML